MWGPVEAVRDSYLDWKFRQISLGVRQARHVLSDCYTIGVGPQSWIERRAYAAFRRNYLRKTEAQINRERAWRAAVAIREAEKRGALQASQKIADLTAYLGTVMQEPVPETQVIDTAIRVLSGVLARNASLESEHADDLETLASFETQLKESRKMVKTLGQENWLANAQITTLREQIRGSNPRAGEPGAQPLGYPHGLEVRGGIGTDPIRDVRIHGVGQTTA